MVILHRATLAALACAGLLAAAPAPAAQSDLTSPAVQGGSVALGGSAEPGIVLAHDERRDRRGRYDRDRRERYDRDRYRRNYRHREHPGYRWEYDHRRHWRSDPHPRREYWRGRALPRRGRLLVIDNYWNYHLPPPPRGHYYVRTGDDVFLVLEATRTVIEAFILLELLNR